MINKSLTYIKNYIAKEIGSYGEVVLGALNRDGQTIDGDLIITLVRIEEERSAKSPEHYRYIRDEEGVVTGVINVNPEISINLYLLISSRKEPYETALTLVSKVISLFQTKNVFRKADFSEMSGVDTADIESLTLDLCPLTFEQNNSLWQTLGVTLMPSVLYKMRALVIREIITGQGAKNPILPESMGGGITLDMLHFDENEDKHNEEDQEDMKKEE